jgi:hypothetical protein
MPLICSAIISSCTAETRRWPHFFADASPDVKGAVEKAVDTALHNVCDMLEGFWRLKAGPEHTISLALGVQFRDPQNEVVEIQEISPCKLDLPIGYWKWTQERKFR